jgi:integrase/recombinase XerC
VSPMARMRPPIVPDQPVPVVPEDGLRRLLGACVGKDFEARRDTAIVMFLLDTGARRAELADLQLPDLDLDLDVAIVLGKGRRERALPYGRKTAVALDRYLHVRARHKDAHLPWLWLGKRGRLPLGASSSSCGVGVSRLACQGSILISSATPSRTPGLPKAAARPT